jgi:hypothetical protein
VVATVTRNLALPVAPGPGFSRLHSDVLGISAFRLTTAPGVQGATFGWPSIVTGQPGGILVSPPEIRYVCLLACFKAAAGVTRPNYVLRVEGVAEWGEWLEQAAVICRTTNGVDGVVNRALTRLARKEPGLGPLPERLP